MSWIEPINVMDQVISEMDPSDDFIAVTEAEEAMKQSASRRAQEADDIRESLRALSRQLEAARMSATRPSTVPSEAQHTQILQDLEEQQYTLGKKINEAQDMLRSKEADVVHLRVEEKDLDARDETSAHELDSTSLRLATTKGLGFEAIVDNDGSASKILIISHSGEVHTINTADSTPAFERTNMLWRLASS